MPNENIMGIPTKACINGITKADSLEIKKIPTLESETSEMKNETIPSLDERITALEQGGSGGSEWEELDVSTYDKAHALLNTWFTTDGDHYFLKNDMMIWYGNKVHCVDKDSNINIATIRYIQFNETSAYVNIVENSFYVANVFVISSSQGQNYYNYTEKALKFNKTDWSISYTSFGSFTYRNRLRVFVKKS